MPCPRVSARRLTPDTMRHASDTPSLPQKQETREEPPCLLPAGLEGDGCSRRATPWWRPPRQPHRGRCAIPIEAAAPCLDEAAAPCPGGAAGPLAPRCPRRRPPRRSPRAAPGGGYRAARPARPPAEPPGRSPRAVPGGGLGLYGFWVGLYGPRLWAIFVHGPLTYG